MINWEILYRCNCGHCVSMPTAIECVCCCEIQEFEDKKSDVTPAVKCITNHPGFCNVCLDICGIAGENRPSGAKSQK